MPEEITAALQWSQGGPGLCVPRSSVCMDAEGAGGKQRDVCDGSQLLYTSLPTPHFLLELRCLCSRFSSHIFVREGAGKD